MKCRESGGRSGPAFVWAHPEGAERALCRCRATGVRASPQDEGASDRDRRAEDRADHIDPIVEKFPSTRSGPKDLAGFIDAPLIGLDHRPARMM
jgi:hypothetical protein